MPELTICTVSYDSGPYIDQNISLASRLNIQDKPKWLICENSLPNSFYRLSNQSRNIQIIEGERAEDHGTATGSYHHAAGLAKLLPHVETRFLLVLDPDFFIVRPQWIPDVLCHMQINDLSFFGAPWHPTYITKYRYFPCVHCMFIDLSKVNIETLDFRPLFDKQTKPGTPHPPHLLLPLVPLITKNQPERKKFLWEKRFTIGSSPDTGYQVYKEYYKDSSIRFECLVPAFVPDKDSKYLRNKTNRILERMLPEALSYAPKQKSSYTHTYFRDKNYPDTHQIGWDEFFWQQQPFGFHIRNSLKIKQNVSDVANQANQLTEVLNQLSIPSVLAPLGRE